MSFFCPTCAREVVLFGVSPGAMPEEALDKMHELAEAEGRIVLWNPPPFLPLNCPCCGTVLENREDAPAASATAQEEQTQNQS